MTGLTTLGAKLKPTNFKLLIRKIKCLLSLHVWEPPIIASYGTACKWAIFGKKCVHCKKYEITQAQIAAAIKTSYSNGVEDENTRMIAYAKGLPEILKHYPDSPLKYGFIRYKQ